MPSVVNNASPIAASSSTIRIRGRSSIRTEARAEETTDIPGSLLLRSQADHGQLARPRVPNFNHGSTVTGAEWIECRHRPATGRTITADIAWEPHAQTRAPDNGGGQI